MCIYLPILALGGKRGEIELFPLSSDAVYESVRSSEISMTGFKVAFMCMIHFNVNHTFLFLSNLPLGCLTYTVHF